MGLKPPAQITLVKSLDHCISVLYNDPVYVYKTITLPMTGYSASTKSVVYSDGDHTVRCVNENGLIWFYHATKITKPDKNMRDMDCEQYLNYILDLSKGVILCGWKEKFVMCRHACYVPFMFGWTSDHLSDYCPCSC